MSSNESVDDIRLRLEMIRRKQPQRVALLQAEAGRLTDWREYVRAAPWTALAGSLAAGVIAVNAFAREPKSVLPQNFPVRNFTPPEKPKSKVKQIAAWTTSLVAPFVIGAAKRQLNSVLMNLVQGATSGTQSHSESLPKRSLQDV